MAVPQTLTVAISGGVDSVAAVDFLQKNRDITAAFFHHGNEFADQELEFVTEFCRQRGIRLITGGLTQSKPRNKSPEEFWREQRYAFLSKIPGHVITAHTLDDCVETWIHSSLHGQSKLIPAVRDNVIRPFLVTAKSDFIQRCQSRNITWLEDPSNQDHRHMRNYIRHVLLPNALQVNPGLHKVIRKKILAAQKNA